MSFLTALGGLMNEFTGKADPPLLLLEALLALPNIEGEEEEGIPELVEDPKVFTIFWWF